MFSKNAKAPVFQAFSAIDNQRARELCEGETQTAKGFNYTSARWAVCFANLKTQSVAWFLVVFQYLNNRQFTKL
jgi:hypothetical protein